MILLDRVAQFEAVPSDFTAFFEREPFGFNHNLSGLDLLSLENLERLSHGYHSDDYFVAAGAPAARTPFYSVAHSLLAPHEAIAKLDTDNQRVLLKRPENYDPRFRELLDELFAFILVKSGSAHRPIVRLQSSILISSSETITPFHFDPRSFVLFSDRRSKDISSLLTGDDPRRRARALLSARCGEYRASRPSTTTPAPIEQPHRVAAPRTGAYGSPCRGFARRRLHIVHDGAGGSVYAVPPLYRRNVDRFADTSRRSGR